MNRRLTIFGRALLILISAAAFYVAVIGMPFSPTGIEGPLININLLTILFYASMAVAALAGYARARTRIHGCVWIGVLVLIALIALTAMVAFTAPRLGEVCARVSTALGYAVAILVIVGLIPYIRLAPHGAWSRLRRRNRGPR